MNMLHKVFGVILFLFFSVSVAAQKPPPGTVRLKPSKTETQHATFIDKNMVTFLNWLDFLSWLMVTDSYWVGVVEKDTALYNAMLPDSLICSQVYHEKGKGISMNPLYWDKPLVGITYEQALEYCKWRSDRVNQRLKLKKKKYTVSYTLPTEADFKEAAKQNKQPSIYFHCQGELTAEKTVVIKNCGIIFQPYQGAEVSLGFRCVAEIKK